MFLMTRKREANVTLSSKEGGSRGQAGWPQPGKTKEKSLVGAVSNHEGQGDREQPARMSRGK